MRTVDHSGTMPRPCSPAIAACTRWRPTPSWLAISRRKREVRRSLKAPMPSTHSRGRWRERHARQFDRVADDDDLRRKVVFALCGHGAGKTLEEGAVGAGQVVAALHPGGVGRTGREGDAGGHDHDVPTISPASSATSISGMFSA